ncbi:unnamed protein product [Thelazia callipaeda]|uniref:BLOC-1-related complex subunit 5 n=1 Tax=Thelazia callipaeda TaxID=103827 RepID=A0A0N5D890_THECL|nr:unnamed protein product [Thelazia callipaeda]
MGNGQSSKSASSTSNSFLAGKKSSSTSKGKVIIVRQGTNTEKQLNASNDDVLKRFSEIPKFYPILKSVLNPPGVRDPSEAVFRISTRPVLMFAYRLQEHLSQCANVVVVQQELLGNLIKSVSALLIICKIMPVNFLHLCHLCFQFLFQDLMPIVQTMNEILPQQNRLPVLNIDPLPSKTNGVANVENKEEVSRDQRNSVGNIEIELHNKKHS